MGFERDTGWRLMSFKMLFKYIYLNFSLPFYLISNGNFASLFEIF